MSERTHRARLVLCAALAGVCGMLCPSMSASGAEATPPPREPLLPPGAAVSARDTEPLQQQPILPVAPSPTAGTARTPLMGLLDKAGLGGPLDEARIRVYGHVEGSYTYNWNNPSRDINAGRVFDIEHDDLTLNQATINVERLVDMTQKQFDIGGRVEMMWGGDSRFIHGNGLFDNHDNDTGVDINGGPDNQWDLTQAYADIALPIGDGLRIRAGKFAYFKQIDPNYSVFYSHSFTFGAALPFTLTGVYGTYKLGDNWTIDLGVSRGWDQALEDNNGAIDYFGRIKYELSPQTSIEAKLITGPEQTADNGNWRTVLNLTLSHQFNENLQFFVDGVYGQQSQPTFAVFDDGIAVAGGGGEARWYGVSGYAIQRINDYVSVAARAEVFRDEEGYTTALAQTLFEATFGVTITPFPHDAYGQYFKLRPELRYDWSNENFFSDFSRADQWTVAVDAIYNF